MLFKTQFNGWVIYHLNLLLNDLPPPWLLALLSLLLVGGQCAAPRLAHFNRPEWRHRNTTLRLMGRIVQLVAQAGILVVVLVVALTAALALQVQVLAQLWSAVGTHIQALGGGAAMGFVLGLTTRWFVLPHLEREDGLSFIDKKIAKLSTKKEFDPRPFFTKGSSAIFIGKNERGRPVRLSFAIANSAHISIAGSTGSGKGIGVQTFTSQFHRHGQTIVVFDPKPCHILPQVLAQEALLSKRTMNLIDIRQAVPQINPLAGLSKVQFVGLLIEIFELKKTGEPKSDHYREAAQRGIRRLAEMVPLKKNDLTFQGLLALAQATPDIAESENLMIGLEKFAQFTQFHTTQGLDIEMAIERGDVVYIAGDGADEDAATMQRALLARTMQILANRRKATRPVCLVIDELSDLLGPTVLALLAKMRSNNVHALLMFQTPGDLRSARGVDPDVAFSKCWANTTIKLVYHLEEVRYATELAERIGSRPTQTRTVSRDNATGATRETWAQIPGLKVEAQDITNLPIPVKGSGQAAMGYLIGDGEAKLVYLGPVPIDQPASKLKVFCAPLAPQMVKPEERI
jgi:hypothetical protein